MEEKDNLDLLEEERRRLLKEDLSGVSYASEDSKKYLEDLKDLSAMANKERELKIEEEKIKVDAENKKKERRHGLILGIIDGTVKLVVAGVTVVVCVMNNESAQNALSDVLGYEASGEYISSKAGQGLVGSICSFFRKK